MRKVAVIGFVLCVMFSTLLCGCGRVNYKNMKADDEISKQIYEALGEDVYYISKEESQGINCYHFFLKREDKEVVKEFLLLADGTMTQSSEKIYIYLGCQIPGGKESPFLLANYSDDPLKKANSNVIKEVYIRYPDISECEVFKDPEIYTVLEDIQYLVIDEELQKIAEEQGIDWYEVWPTLEEMWVRSGSEKIKVERDTE